MEVDKVNNTNIKLMQVAQPFGQIYSSFKCCFSVFFCFFCCVLYSKKGNAKIYFQQCEASLRVFILSARQGVPLHIHKYVTWPVIAPDITPPTQINRKYKKNTAIFTSCGCGRCHDYNKEIGEYVTSWPVAALSFMDGGPPVDNRVTKLRLNLTVEPQDIYPCISLLIYPVMRTDLCNYALIL